MIRSASAAAKGGDKELLYIYFADPENAEGRDALGEAITLHSGLVHSRTRGTLALRDDADDAAQIAYMNACRSIRSYDRSLPFPTWLGNIARNAALGLHTHNTSKCRDQRRNVSIEELRGNSVEGGDENAFDPLLDQKNSDPQDIAIENERQRMIARIIPDAIGQLGGRRREVMTLYVLERKSDTEIAEELGITASTVRDHLKKARVDLKEILRDVEV